MPEDWSLSRIDSLLRAVLRAAVWELKNCKEIDSLVILNEYMDITKAFYDSKELKLVNAILNNVSQSIRGS